MRKQQYLHIRGEEAALLTAKGEEATLSTVHMYILEVRQQQYLPNTVNMSCAAVQEQYLHCHCEYCCAFLTCWLYDRRGQGAEGPGTW